LAIDPRHPPARNQLVRQLLAKGLVDDAIAEARLLLEANPGYIPGLGILGLCLAEAGQAEEALGILRRLDDESRQHYVSALQRARITAGLRDRDATLRYLGESVAAREGTLPWLTTDREFDFLHGDPRFTAIINEIGIPRQKTDSTDLP
jgi:tetratricopeptide (TPR) repeat protein